MLARVAAVVVLLLLGVVAMGVCAPAVEEAEAPPVSGDASGAEPTADVAAPINPMEEPCMKAGGLCLLEGECPAGRLTEARGLCPAQRARGVECCYGLSIKERRCSARGGICRPKQKCGRSLWEEKAEDCASDETCCVLVQ